MEAYLTFGGNCEEALNFYKQCLGGEITALMRYEGTPMDGAQLPPEWKQKVLHSVFDAKGARFMASDAPPGQPKPAYSGITMSVYVPGPDHQPASQAFDALSQGGKVTMPFAPPFWGGHFGMLVDKFGVPWMVTSEH
ncbi:VOC family protein [Ramlibacter humi]|uniref:VOC family protein n=1 Tax=Ramlibacter humi TaxID=2530451 RepID=A0A4Z0BE27_9BURK|nr:VOC family protein [Ramlibacter humi]